MPRRFVTCVSFYAAGFGEATRVVEAVSVCDAARRAVEAFRSDLWHGPRPDPGDWLEVTLVGGDRRPYWVQVSKALEIWDRNAAKKGGGLAAPSKH